jgi:hypothetical protein
MERFWSSLAFSYGDTLRRITSRARLSTLTNPIADSDVAFDNLKRSYGHLFIC